MFGFQNLDVYRCAIAFLPRATALAERAGPRQGGLADQLRRAALSIPLNIAEGAGRFERDQRRFYVIARGSALECAAILDAFEVLGLVGGKEIREERGMLLRVVAMLSAMTKE